MSLPAALTLATVESVLPRADALAGAGTLDLSGVARADSAGVALLLELQRRAARQGRTLAFTGAPPQVRGLLEFFGLESALSVS